MNEGAVDVLVKLSCHNINADLKGQIKVTPKLQVAVVFRASYGGRFRIPG